MGESSIAGDFGHEERHPRALRLICNVTQGGPEGELAEAVSDGHMLDGCGIRPLSCHFIPGHSLSSLLIFPL